MILAYFSAISAQIVAFFSPQMTLTTLKLAYYHAPMYVLGIYCHLPQYKDG